MIHDFSDGLAWSKGRVLQSDMATLRAMFPECLNVEKTETDLDRAGVDYLISLRRGGVVTVDAKARRQGCSRFWRNKEPEVPMETWSVMPGGKYDIPPERAKVGWTLDESKNVDLILFTFDPADHEYAYVRSFPLLRETFRRYYSRWTGKSSPYKRDVQDSREWQSMAHFVPLWVVDEAMKNVARHRTALDDPEFTTPQDEAAPVFEQLDLEIGGAP